MKLSRLLAFVLCCISAIEPGSLDDSVLWSAITWNDYEMPPKQKLPAEVISHFKKWIEMGAPDPRVRENSLLLRQLISRRAKSTGRFSGPKRMHNLASMPTSIHNCERQN